MSFNIEEKKKQINPTSSEIVTRIPRIFEARNSLICTKLEQTYIFIAEECLSPLIRLHSNQIAHI